MAGGGWSLNHAHSSYDQHSGKEEDQVPSAADKELSHLCCDDEPFLVSKQPDTS